MRETIASRRNAPKREIIVSRCEWRDPMMALRCITRAQWHLVTSQDGASLYYTCAMEFSNPPKMALHCITRAQWYLVPTI